MVRAIKTAGMAGLLLLALRFAPHPGLLDSVPWSRAVYAADGQLMRLTLAGDQQYRLRTPLREVSPAYVEAVLLYEDRWFYWHPGVNPLALGRSAFATLSGSRRMGGSTLSMQLARQLYQIDSRSVWGKVRQVAAALWIELRHGKHEILEAYLNRVPFGGNIEGIGAASLIHFHKSASQLDLQQSLALAVIPQNPLRRLATQAENAALRAARLRLWQVWLKNHPGDAGFNADQMLSLQASPRTALPFEAPHAVDLLLRSPGQNLQSSLDLRLQHALERVLREYLLARRTSGVVNASALLLDARDMQVKAMLGSAAYFDEQIDGQVNGTQAKRSPGSTLKPFIYGLALDQGILHPMSILKDAPTSFGPFSPENYDGRFVGPITAQDALIRSRNIPAVAVAAKLSRPNLYDFLKMAGISRMESPQHYGLALVLGGGEVTMEELAQLYAMLANGGEWRPASLLASTPSPQPLPREGGGDPVLKGTRLMSEEASFIVLDMLRQNIRPDTLAPARPPVAWKTGTSWGFRDAWTAGVFGPYVLVVWLGNFEGHGNPALIGIDMAAPLFLRMVDAVRAEGLAPGEVVRRQPPDLRKVEVCTASGELPDALCPATSTTWFIAGKSPITRSRLHRTVWIDRRTGKATCNASAGAVPQVVEYWPSELQHLFRQSGLPRQAPPQGLVCEESANESAGPRITSPLRGVSYTLRVSRPEPLLLRAEAQGGVNELFWFVDGAMAGRTRPGETLLWRPKEARHYTVRVVDDSGHADSRDLVVEFVP
ncbi:MAG: penicillin-binding protein 1C [Sulfuricellaceae bacterium]|nr:penicillin-binding protein 1C [Sulfuricellaceae bacterium]